MLAATPQSSGDEQVCSCVSCVHERPQRPDKEKVVGAALAATYLPPPEGLAHCKGNCDILGAGFLLPTVISAQLSKTPGLLPMGGGGRGQG